MEAAQYSGKNTDFEAKQLNFGSRFRHVLAL